MKMNNNLKIGIVYNDFSKVLRISVLDVGRYYRKKVTQTVAKIGTRMKNNRRETIPQARLVLER